MARHKWPNWPHYGWEGPDWTMPEGIDEPAAKCSVRGCNQNCRHFVDGRPYCADHPDEVTP